MLLLCLLRHHQMRVLLVKELRDELWRLVRSLGMDGLNLYLLSFRPPTMRNPHLDELR